MINYLYEKDLRGMRYNILISPRHDMVTTALSERYAMKKPEIVKILIRRLDMILLENLPSRYDVGIREDEKCGVIAQGLGCVLLTRAIPLVSQAAMDDIVETVNDAIRSGTTENEAIEMGKSLIRELILS